MSNTVIARRTPRRSANKLVAAVCAAVIGIAAGVLGAAPANATDSRCTIAEVGVNCGMIFNTSNYSIRIATNFSPTYSSTVGTASGATATLYSGQNSNILKDSSGRYYDWDAVYVGAKSCLSMNVGAGMGDPVYYNNTRTFGVWYKVNNFGANVRNLKPC